MARIEQTLIAEDEFSNLDDIKFGHLVGTIANYKRRIEMLLASGSDNDRIFDYSPDSKRVAYLVG